MQAERTHAQRGFLTQHPAQQNLQAKQSIALLAAKSFFRSWSLSYLCTSYDFQKPDFDSYKWSK